MILILSTDGDVATNDVINWLRFHKQQYVRLNDNDLLRYEFVFSFKENGDPWFRVAGNNVNFCSDDVSVVWFRKFGYYNALPHFNTISNTHSNSFLHQFRNEYTGALNLVFLALKNKKWLLRPEQVTPSKMRVLSFARKAGLKIPNTVILNSKAGLQQVLQQNNVITKSLKDCHSFITAEHFVTMFTTQVPSGLLENLPDTFMPSLLQENEAKQYELRIFYLKEQCHTMAIFSQNDSQTTLDFRRYNWEKPNRYVPFNLPEEIRLKLVTLMQSLELDTGSIDMIYNTKGEYVFLEVNPCGQFAMASRPCHFYLEKIIAEDLMKMSA
jgi:ATP-GRASP peptide maturase of grasp-with-spasm system